MDYNNLPDNPNWMEAFARPAPQAQPKKKKNFWLDQISTAGGILGGIGGSLIAPIAGTAAGAGAGSALGEALENAITGDSLTKNVVKEGALGAVFGAGPLKLAKAGYQAGGKALGKQAVKEVTEGVTRTASERGTQNLLGNAWGIKTGAKVGSTKPLTPQAARELQKFVKDVGVAKSANADMVAERLVNYRKIAGANIDDIVRTNNRAFSPRELGNLTKSIQARIDKLALVSPNAPPVRQLLDEVKTSGDISSLVKYRRSLDDTINFARNEASPDPLTERIATAARDEIDRFTSRLVPGLKAANSQYSKASKAIDYVVPAAKDPKGITILGNKIGGKTFQRASAALGQTSGAINSQLNKAVTTTPRGIAGRLGAVGAARGIMGGPSDLETSIIDAQSAGVPNMPMSATTMSPNTIQPNMGSQYQNSGNMSSPITRESALEAMIVDLQNGGKNIDKIMALYEFANPPEAQSSLELTDGAIKTVTDIEGALSDIGTLSSRISDSNITGPISGRIRSANPFDTDAQSLQSEINRVRQVVGKALEGGVLRKEDEVKYAKILPTMNDTKQVALNKLNELQRKLSEDLSTYVALQQSSGKGRGQAPASLEQALMQYQ